jgi:hypothetical protein
MWAPPGAPDWGVRTEYPICIDQNNRLCGLDPVWEGDAPSYHQCIAQGLQPLVIFDVAIEQQRHIVCGLEVVHRNRPSPQKLDYLKRIRAEARDLLNVGIVEADWILSQCGRPSSIKLERLFWSKRGRCVYGEFNSPEIVLAETVGLARASRVSGRSAWTTDGSYGDDEVVLPGFVKDIQIVAMNEGERWRADNVADHFRRAGRQCSVVVAAAEKAHACVA